MASTFSMLRRRACRKNNGPPECPFPHFYDEALAYISGDVEVLDALPAVQASALRKARRSKTHAVPPTKENGLEQVLDTSFTVLVRHEMPLTTTPPATSRGSAQGITSHTPLRSVSTTITNQGSYPVYDGLRSSPPTGRTTNPHAWKIYTGPFFDASLPSPPIETKQATNHLGSINPAPDSPQIVPNFSRPSMPQQPARVLRTPPKLATKSHHHHHQQQPTNPPPTPVLPPAPFQRLPPPRPPTYGSHQPPNPTPRHPSPPRQQPWPHYTSPDATTLLTSLKSYLLLPATGPASPTPAELLANLLLKWPAVRRELHTRNPHLAGLVNAIDWTGVGGMLPEECFRRRVVEGWVGDRGVLFAGDTDWEGVPS